MSKIRISVDPQNMTRLQERVGNHTYYDSCGTACGSTELKKHAAKNRQHAELNNRQHAELMKRLTDSVRQAAHCIMV